MLCSCQGLVAKLRAVEIHEFPATRRYTFWEFPWFTASLSIKTYPKEAFCSKIQGKKGLSWPITKLETSFPESFFWPFNIGITTGTPVSLFVALTLLMSSLLEKKNLQSTPFGRNKGEAVVFFTWRPKKRNGAIEILQWKSGEWLAKIRCGTVSPPGWAGAIYQCQSLVLKKETERVELPTISCFTQISFDHFIPPGKDGWVATPTSLGLSWLLTFRHLLGVASHLLSQWRQDSQCFVFFLQALHQPFLSGICKIP